MRPVTEFVQPNTSHACASAYPRIPDRYITYYVHVPFLHFSGGHNLNHHPLRPSMESELDTSSSLGSEDEDMDDAPAPPSSCSSSGVPPKKRLRGAPEKGHKGAAMATAATAGGGSNALANFR